MPYATPSDMLQRYDARLIGDLVSDTGVTVAAVDLPTNPVLLAVLDDASASVDAAVFVGASYTPDQMASLSDSAAAFVRRLVCDLALIYLKRRRGRFDSERDAALLKEVNASLDGLRSGDDLLLGVDDAIAPASLIELVTPTLIDVNRARTVQGKVQNYYPKPRLGSPRHS